MQSSLFNADLLNGYRAFKVYHILIRLHLQSLELRRLITDLTWCYKIVFGYVDIDIGDNISFSPDVHSRGHGYKLFKPLPTTI